MIATAAHSGAERRILCPVLVGRDSDLQRLAVLLRECMAGHGRTALVSGEAGVGKTAILHRFIQQARAEGARVLSGECTEIDARRPFGPFMDIARAANRANALPVASPGATTTGVDRYRLYSAFTALLADLARDRPLVIVIEDLHWADEASLELFPHLARKLRDVSLLLVGTYRTDELHRRHPLRPVLAEMSRSRVADDIALPRLSEDEVAHFLREAMHLDRQPTVEFRKAMFEACEGNPLFMEEVLRALVERGDVEYRDGSWRRTKEVAEIAIPDTLRDAVLERFRTLPAQAQNVLHYAAVIGQRFDFDLLRRVTGSDEAMIFSALRVAIDAQLLLELTDDEGHDRYTFRHALTRESVLLELLQRERRRIHAAVGETIESLAGKDSAPHAEDLAYHFDQAGDRDRASRYHDLAGREAFRLFAFARAERHLERAIELAQYDEPMLGSLQLRLADAAYLAAAPRRALRAAEQARSFFEEAGDVRAAGVALTRVSLYRWLVGKARRAKDAAQEAARLLESLGESTELAGAYAQVATLAWLDRDLSVAGEWGQRALDMARKTETLRIEVDASITVGSVEAFLGRPEGIARLRGAIDLASAHDLVEPAIRGFQNLAFTLHSTGSSGTEVRRVFDELFAYARRHDLRQEMIVADEAYWGLVDGEWDGALTSIQEARGESVWMPILQMMEAIIRAGRDGPERSLPLLAAPRRWLGETTAGHSSMETGLLVRATLLAGDARAALKQLEDVAAEVVGTTYRDLDEAAVSALVGAIALGDTDAISRAMDVALTEERGPRRVSGRARRSFAQAERAAVIEALDTAIPLLAESADHFKDALLPFGETLARRRRAELLLRRNTHGDREAAQAELAAILPYWRKAKATWYLGQLRLWATELGLDFPEEGIAATPSPTRAARTQLTAREREVAALVADGLSNNEIATKLVISERTAEGHVERILGKLGFRSRAQIASWHAGGDPTRVSS